MKALSIVLIYALLASAQTGGQAKPQQTAQQPAQAPAAKPTGVVTFQSNTQLVVETISVKDKNGNPVEGLKAKDFTITEDGVQQTIAFCEYQKLDDSTVPEAQPETTVIASSEAKPADAVKSALSAVAGVTNHQIQPEKPGDIRYRDRRLLALYFDMSAMPIPDQVRALTAADKFIRTQMRPADLMAILQFNGSGVQVLQDFTANKTDLEMVISKLLIADSGLGETTNDDSTADSGSAFGEDDSEFNLFTTDRQLNALQTAVKMLGQLNEKKVLVYFASGLQLNGIDNQAQMLATTNAAIRANVSFYPVDARGLIAMSPLGDATRGSPGGMGMYSGASAMMNMNNFQKTQDTLYALAADTGGKALLDNNDLSQGVVNAQKSISSYYIVGYYSANTAMDGRYRRIKVTMSDPSWKLDYRQGYWAGKEFKKFTTVDKERQLVDALMLGDPITELTISMEVNYFQLNSAEYYIPVAAKIPGSELALARKGGAEHTMIDFIGEVKDEYNVTVANVRDKIDIKLSGATAQQLTKQPIQYDTGFTLLPGTYSLKFLARDDETGRIGTYINKFVVPNLNKDQKRVPLSSVVLSGQRLDMRDALFTAKDKTVSVNPLIQNGQKLIPSVTRVFSRSRDMYIYLQAYERGQQTQQPLVAYVTFYRGQSKAFETSPLPVTEGMDPKSKAVPLGFAFALNKLQPGRYTCQVTVIDPAGQRASYWQAPVMLVQ